MSDGPAIENNLAAMRKKRGLSAARLAEMTGVSRQTVYAIEGGAYVPNTAVALRLARALEAGVEELFSLPAAGGPAAPRTEAVAFLRGAEEARAGQPVQLCRVGRRMVASAPAPGAWYLPVADAVMQDSGCAQLFGEEENLEYRLLVAGCDPGISVLARHVRRAGIDLVVAHRNSTDALALLRQGSIHIAGTHLHDEASGESNLPVVRSMFPGGSVAVVSFAVWEEGLVVAPGNPKKIRGVPDLAKRGVTIVNREAGAGARALLDSQLERAGMKPGRIRGYQRTAQGHLAAAWYVAAGQADCCIATRAAARLFSLDFVPLASERYDLVLHRRHLRLPSMELLLDALSRAGFRRELEGVGGYDTSVSGRRLL